MSSNKPSNVNKRTIENILQSITSVKRQVPKSGFVLLLILYILATVTLNRVTHSGGEIMLGSYPFALRSAAGIFSSLANLCVILLVVLYRKVGFITGLVIIIGQIPMMLFQIIMLHNYDAIPGVFTNGLTIIAIVIININHNRVDRFQKEVLEQAVTDRLTGLPNRFAGREYFAGLVKVREKFVYVATDINNFKSINDTMGYETGNKVLKEIANRWRDLADNGNLGTFNLVAHISGDEFGFSIQEYNSEEDVIRTINRFREELERRITIDDCDYYVNASFGYAEFPTDAEDLETLISGASLALHDAKRRGILGDPVRYTKELVQNEKSLETERKIRSALANDTIFFHLQPQYDINHKLRGFEALARMKDADGNYIPPMEFIPVAERSGLVDQIDMAVFKRAAEFLQNAGKTAEPDFTISVNISVKHLLKNSFIDDVKGILETYDVAAEHIEIEITESIMIDSVERALGRIEEVRKLGIMVAIDDFGTGYSSLSYLNSFPANLLKIDKSFIDVMNQAESNKKYVASIISIGHILGLEVISEGVESEDQLETLKEIGCDYIQGFIWGRPVPPEEAAKLIAQQEEA